MNTKWTDSINTTIYRDSLAIRKAVFIEEQGISPAIEIHDEDPSYHLVTYCDSIAIATCRLKIVANDTLKIQRFAVTKNNRNKTVGKQLLKEVERFALEHTFTTLVLSAQEHALPFYLNQGYKLTGEPFLEAGISHSPLAKSLTD